MSATINEHLFEPGTAVCKRCKHTYEQIMEKEIHCGKLTCSRCGGTRHCVSTPPVCEECWSYKPFIEMSVDSMEDAVEKLCAKIMNEAFLAGERKK